MKMIRDLKLHVMDWNDDRAIEKYLVDVFEGRANDRTGKI
jgi:hypothetical protein